MSSNPDLYASLVRNTQTGPRRSPVWNDAQVDYIRAEWVAGTTTAEMGRRCSTDFRVPVTKNAIVGACHRAHFDQRTNPVIRRPVVEAYSAPPPAQPAGASTLQPLISVASVILPPARPRAHAAPRSAPRPSPVAASLPAPGARASAPQPPPADSRCAQRTFCGRRDDDSGCRWPLGDPSDRRSFHLCDAPLETKTDVYCRQHHVLGVTRSQARESRPAEW